MPQPCDLSGVAVRGATPFARNGDVATTVTNRAAAMSQNETNRSIFGGYCGHDRCNCLTAWSGNGMVHDFYIALFAATAGFTASGIMANLYKLAVKKRAETTLSRLTYLTVMIVAGPTVLFNNAAKSWHEKSCSAFAFWLAAAIAGYWSFAIGLLVVQVALAL